MTVNESREQTRAIHVLQRSRQTLEGLLAEEDHQSVLTLHRNAQGLLERLKVVNPYADSLTFLDDKTRARRDHMKYLSLIRAIALLHQHQRPIRSVQHRGNPVRYVEVEPGDIALANRLAHEVLGRTLDELPPQTRRLLTMLDGWVAQDSERQGLRRCDHRFTRREVRTLTGWGDTQLKVHLARLAALEYVLVHRIRSGQGYEYELLYDGQGETGERFVMGLSEPAEPSYDSQRSGVKAARSGSGRGRVGPRSAGGRTGKSAASPCPTGDTADQGDSGAETHVTPSEPARGSYTHRDPGAGK